MTNYEYKEAMRKLAKLARIALEFAKDGEIDTVIDINNAIADLAKKYSEQ